MILLQIAAKGTQEADTTSWDYFLGSFCSNSTQVSLELLVQPVPLFASAILESVNLN